MDKCNCPRCKLLVCKMTQRGDIFLQVARGKRDVAKAKVLLTKKNSLELLVVYKKHQLYEGKRFIIY